MSPREYADILRLKLNELISDNKPLKLAATTATVLISTRIFIDGEDSSGSKIGKYSTKGLYLSDSVMDFLNINGRYKTNEGKPNFKKGEPGKSVFENGDKHKTTWFQGWKGVRSSAGRQTEKVDLSFIGDLQSEFTNTTLPAKLKPAPPSKATPRKVDVNTYEIAVRSEVNVNKARGNEKHFNTTIFTPSTEEDKKFNEIVEFELKKLFS